MDEDSPWLCTQAMHDCADDQPADGNDKANGFGCLVLNNVNDNERYLLNEGDNTIGRNPLNHIYIEHPSVSMNHAVIQCDSDGVVLLDKGSLNKTKLNKKTLKKNVAYFLEENAYLMFGEVKANYYVDGEPTDVSNEVQPNAAIETSVQNVTENHEFSAPRLSCNVNTSNMLCNNEMADKIIQSNSTNKTEIIVPKTESEYAKNKHDDVYLESNRSSPSDEFLIDALSQIESQLIPEIVREDTPSPVMDLRSTFSNITHTSSNVFQTINKINSRDDTRDDTPSPVMDLKNSFSNMSHVSSNVFQTTNKMNSNDTRDDTPSPVMDFGLLECNELSRPTTTSHNDPLVNKSHNNVEDLNETQCLEIDNNVKKYSTPQTLPSKNITSTNNISNSPNSSIDSPNKHDFEIDDDFFNFPTQKLQISKKINLTAKLSSTIHEEKTQKSKDIAQSSRASLSNFKHCNSSVQEDCTQIPDMDDDFFNCPTQKVAASKKINSTEKSTSTICKEETQKRPELLYQSEINSCSIKNSSSGVYRDLTETPDVSNEDFFNCPTQKVTKSKKLNSNANLTSTIHEEEIQKPSETTKFSRAGLSNSKHCNSSVQDNLTQIPDMDDDFFNYPTQKLSISKKKNSTDKCTSSINEENKQESPVFVHPREIDSSSIKNSSSGVYRDLTETPDISNEDFFNCPTQKVTKSKMLNLNANLTSTINEEETQKPSETTEFSRAGLSNSKHCNNSVQNNPNQKPDMDDDFFNCPTQKLSISKNKNSTDKCTSSINEEDKQESLIFVHPREIDSSGIKNSSSGVYRDLIETPDINIEDFFNCPTQKVTTTKKLNLITNSSSKINEEETQKPSESTKFSRAGLSNSKHCNSGVQDDLTQIPDMDDDFFNCPTQKLSVSKKIISTEKSTSSIHKKDTQKFPEFVLPSKINSSSGVYRDLTETPDISNEDFFNCPTQKVTTSKKFNSIASLTSTIHEEETQKCSGSTEFSRAGMNKSKHCNSKVQDNLTQIPDMDDDFFNCPTQKVSVSKKISSTEKSSSSIHGKDTQKFPEFLHPSEIDSCSIKNSSSGVYRDLTETPDICNEDFFNCPTQKVTTSKKLNSNANLTSTIHEEETQKPSETTEFSRAGLSNSNYCNNSVQDDLTQIPDMDDDFFNCPTQKLSVSKKIISTEKSTSFINEKDTQKFLEFLHPSKINSSSGVYRDLTETPDISNEDFFNCPTQKVTTSKKLNSIASLTSTIHEEETQKCSGSTEFSRAGLNNSKHCNSKVQDNLTEIPDMDDDFFNCPTQKVSVSKKIVSTEKSTFSVHEKDSQKFPEFLHPSEIDSSSIKNSSSGVYRDLTETPDVNNEDFFNCPTQKLSLFIESKSLSGAKIEETSTSNINNVETQNLSVHEITRMPISKINLPNSNKKQNKENIFGKIPNKIQSNSLNISKKEDKDSNVDSKSGSKPINKKRTVLPNDTEKRLTRNSMRLESNSNNKPCTNENKNSSKSLKTKKKPIIRVRKDLHKSCSVSLSDNSSNNTNNILDNVMVSFVKQEPSSDGSMECAELNSHSNKPSTKCTNEIMYSPLNIPNLSESSFQQHSTPEALEGNSNSLNCEPSCSNTAANKWKSFWNKKKSASEARGKSDSQENVKKSNSVDVKDRYQTRANAKRENATENNRKRKQDSVIVEDRSKRLCYADRENELNPLIPSTETVVTFSFLRNRHLQELKHFIDTTGGSVTEEITQCTVLVTDKIRCTMKILSAIAKGCPIVNATWIKHSYAVKKFQDFDEFLITDKDAERKYKFQLKESLARAKTSRLLEGYTVLVTPSVKPGPKDMKVIITCAGGNFTQNWPTKRVQKELIVTCDQDRRRWKPMWDNSAAKIIHSDTLVTSIIRQKLSV